MYQLDSNTYFAHVREDIISQLNGPVGHILEVGAGGCGTIVEIKKRGLAREVTAAELFKIENSLQNSPLIDNFMTLDLNSQVNLLPDHKYEVIIAADVLEHLLDPWTVLRDLSKKLLPGGKMIISLPNIRNLKTMKSVFYSGSFAYVEEGVLDRTHLRFFCYRDMKRLIEGAGLSIDSVSFSCESKSPALKLLPRSLKEFLSTQIIFTAANNV